MSDYQPHPLRVQLRRTKGWRKPEGAIIVARPSKWGNPFKGSDDRYLNVHSFRQWLTGMKFRSVWALVDRRRAILTCLPQLRGKQLCCWCALDQPCHADVLAELANSS